VRARRKPTTRPSNYLWRGAVERSRSASFFPGGAVALPGIFFVRWLVRLSLLSRDRIRVLP
jgi:hypothetical protein